MKPLEKLVDGFKNFREHYYVAEPDLYDELIHKGQSPKTLVISCCDSRVHPVSIFSAEPGEIFVVRNVANLVQPFEAETQTHGAGAAIEYAVKHLKVEHIVVIGHGQCGGIKSVMDGGVGPEKGSYIDPWMYMALPVRDKILNDHADLSFSEQCQLCEKEVIVASLKNLGSLPWVKSEIDAGNLEIHGWYFEINEGALYALDQKDGYFHALS